MPRETVFQSIQALGSAASFSIRKEKYSLSHVISASRLTIDFVGQFFHSCLTGIERMNLAGKMPFCCVAAYGPIRSTRVGPHTSLTMSSVPSVEPSLTMTHFSGSTVCAITDCIVNSMNFASLRAGVTTT